MAKLVVTSPDGKTTEVALDKERVTIGRHPDNNIPLPDTAISGKHAVVITIGGSSFLEDLNSTNGTFVAGSKVKKHPLSSGDIITLGRCKISYQGDDAGQDEFERTMVIGASQMAALKVPPPPDIDKPMAPATPEMKDMVGLLQVQDGPFKGRELKLTRALNNIGRPPEVAAVTKRHDGYYISHIGDIGPGVKRVLVNGTPVNVQPQKLAMNDVVELMGTKMRFQLVKG